MRVFIAASFFLLAGWFMVDPLTGAPPVLPTPDFDVGLLSTDPPRVRMTDPPRISVGGLELRCSDCHMIFESMPQTPDELLQHGHLTHDHGMNDRCFNCHAQGERDFLVLHDGTLVGFDQVQDLCAKCHGTVYRDWQVGMHGRTHGSWDPTTGRQWRLTCTDCHDPHAPRFPALAPLPGPRTFRKGAVHPRDEHEDAGPLRRHSSGRGGER